MTSRTRTLARTIPAAAALALLTAGLAGCGDQDATADKKGDEATSQASGTPAPSESAAALPDCADVWVAGKQFPQQYDGCLADGATVPSTHKECSSGQVLETYGDRFYTARGGVVQEVEDATKDLRRDKRYRSALRACNA